MEEEFEKNLYNLEYYICDLYTNINFRKDKIAYIKEEDFSLSTLTKTNNKGKLILKIIKEN